MNLDDVDQAYVDSINGTSNGNDDVVTGLFTIVFVIRPDGSQGYKRHCDIDMPIYSAIGVMEMVKFDWLTESREASEE